MGIKDFEMVVSAVMPRVVALVPKEPAARLGRWQPKRHRQRSTKVLTALDEVGDLLAERLLGALELAVDSLTVDVPPDLVAGLARPEVTTFAVASGMGEQSAVKQATGIVEQVHPGAADLVVDLVEALRGMVSVPEASGDEEEIAAQHGAVHFALAVIVSAAVLRSLDSFMARATPAVVGVALGAAAIALSTAPKPNGYAAAVLAKRRAEYRLPRRSSMSATVTGDQFWIAEGAVPEALDFSGNGLVVAVPGGVAVRTSGGGERQRVAVDVLAEPPGAPDLTGWEEVVDISWTAPVGGARLSGDHNWETPPWPGDYRMRVHARDRDESDDVYRLVIWQEPVTPEVVHKKTDRLGHRLRGEPEPARVVEPDAAYRWIAKTSLSAAATITVVVGLTEDEVVRAFGGDPFAPMSIRSIAEQSPWQRMGQPNYGYQAVLTVLVVDEVVLAVEENGFQGADRARLKALSGKGKAASLYWNVNANFQLSFAEQGELLYAGNPRHETGAPHTEGLDFSEYRYDKPKGLVAIERFTGRCITEEDLAAIYAADRAYLLD